MATTVTIQAGGRAAIKAAILVGDICKAILWGIWSDALRLVIRVIIHAEFLLYTG